MSVFGPSKGWGSFLQNLDQNKLLDLLTDILTLEGHSEIKITDGTGDGKRDVHSIDKYGVKWLSQSKFHKNINKSVTSDEIGELPLGMIKKNYSDGIFITNAKISPQAKSEFLDSYSKLNLRYFDGLELVKTIHHDVILKAVWYDGKSIDQINYLLVIPTVARDLKKDKPLIIPENFLVRGKIGRSEIEITSHRSFEDTSIFHNYRSPSVKTLSEMKTTTIYLSDILVRGHLHLQDIEEILDIVSSEAIEFCRISYLSKSDFAIIFGQPFLLPLSGQISGTRLPLNFSSFTKVFHNGRCQNEEDWLRPNGTGKWVFPRDPRASCADWIRWYCKDHDACLNLTVISSPSKEARSQIEEEYDYFVKWWNKSLFFWIPSGKEKEWGKTGIKEPTYWCKMDDGRILGAWLRSNLTHTHFYSRTEPENDDDSEYHSLEAFGDLSKETKILREVIEDEGGFFVLPEKARHIIGYVAKDPYPIKDEIEYRSIDVQMNTWEIPTPIIPDSRKIQFSVVWLVNGISIKCGPDIIPFVEKSIFHVAEEKKLFKIQFYYDDENPLNQVFIRIDLDYIPIIGQGSTTIVLESIEDEMSGTINQIEAELLRFLVVKRATYYYWRTEIGVLM